MGCVLSAGHINNTVTSLTYAYAVARSCCRFLLEKGPCGARLFAQNQDAKLTEVAKSHLVHEISSLYGNVHVKSVAVDAMGLPRTWAESGVVLMLSRRTECWNCCLG